MKYILLSASILLLTAATCRKALQTLPVCIQQKINEIKAEPKWNPPAEVNEYLYNGKHVYLFSSNCCDQYTVLYDENCNPLCAPSGGLTGTGDNKCTDFLQKAKHIRLVWKDDR